MAFFHTDRSSGVADASVSRSEEPEFDHRPEDQTIFGYEFTGVSQTSKSDVQTLI